ncbi:diguanylate cyclase/phosphodiesterase (GGDEF & EAL domains) with PAS/PAC sensor(s) [hydrothermal vent metagenome]|uniref:Diguanylate cyclase/phosphodiesterase (GGDEF & EAL domains) with PAS/PAC sensor(S) n=1 Tax=hydrothermal vent metagenome TaxID=652676 RepID=A0A1W1D2B9_9ZZZZ
MIDKSFAFIAQQNDAISISVNITEDDLLSKNLKPYLVELLDKYKISASQITLEILEGVSSSGAKNNILQLKELKELGFSLAIDDFGVEYSNFERINELDIDFIKIDAKYIKNIDSNPKSYKIAKAITDFASSMGIKVIAEFVASEQIYEVVKELNIDFSQGYYFSEPSAQI